MTTPTERMIAMLQEQVRTLTAERDEARRVRQIKCPPPGWVTRILERARRSIVTGSISTDTVDELIGLVERFWEADARDSDALRKQVLDLQDQVVRLGGGPPSDGKRNERKPRQVMRQGGWVDA